MSRTQNLRHNVINQMLEAIAKNHIPSPLPSQAALAEMFNISRTTVRHVMEHLQQCGVLEKVAENWIIARQPEPSDGFATALPSPEAQTLLIEQAFFQMINQRQLMAGDSFSELQLAQAVGTSPMAAREFLLRFCRYGLIENIRRGHWLLKKFEPEYAEKLFELRELLEIHALKRFINLPADDPRWVAARDLQRRHRQMRDTIAESYRNFSQLDREMHALILSAAENPFFDQSLELISMIFHFHYQWDESDLKQRNIVALEEHMAILTALISRNDAEAIMSLHRHLNTAKGSMQRSIRQYS